MIIYAIIPIVFLLLLGLTIIHGRYAKAGIGETPLIYKSVIIQFFLNISMIAFFCLSIVLLFYNWKLLLVLLLVGFITENFIVIPIIEKILFLVIRNASSKIENNNLNEEKKYEK